MRQCNIFFARKIFPSSYSNIFSISHARICSIPSITPKYISSRDTTYLGHESRMSFRLPNSLSITVSSVRI